MIHWQFIMGSIASKLYLGPSKNFLVFFVVLYSGLALYVGSELSQVYRLLPGYVLEWAGVDTAESFVGYLALFSIFILFQAAAMIISRAAFLSAYYLKAIYGTTIVPKC